MKSVKLNLHKRNAVHNNCDDELVISQKDFPNAEIGDVVEIYAPEDNYCRLLLQIRSFDDRLKNSVSIEHSIAQTFQLRIYGPVNVKVVDRRTVVLDSIELFFRDQYFSRSDMWILKKSVTDTCVYLNKRLDFNNMRCEVFEMWSQGTRMASGYVNADTKIVFRSASSMVYIFLQMSSEMWDFDFNGDLYFEKAVNGFLTELFKKWNTFKCTHDVTIIFFSRTYYEATDISEFPDAMRECLQCDSKGRYYEDYYRVAIQNERYEDWTTTLVELKKLFYQYEKEVILFHNQPGVECPKGYNSTASQGNFLEVLNMSLNVFERHNLDRSFDRTGQLSVVVSPGVGVYEVDWDLTNLTKQRIIDNGIGSDLVCLGEQPLHAVPLFKYNTDFNSDQYNMPHWINLSFYSSKNRSWTSFIPRIKIPNILPSSGNGKTPGFAQLAIEAERRKFAERQTHRTAETEAEIDYDEYDRQVFKITKDKIKPSMIQRQRSVQHFVDVGSPRDPLLQRRRLSEMTPSLLEVQTPPNSPAHNDCVDGIPINPRNASMSQLSTSFGDSSFKDTRHRLVSSKDDIYCSSKERPKAFINPFDPSHVTIKLNSNRRRWTHVFPLGPTGIFMQQHHCHMISEVKSENNNESDQVDGVKTRTVSESDSTHKRSQQLLTDNSSLWAWGATGEQEWNPAITTGVDWKSLVMPACLPLTTDFLPDKRTLQQDYVDYRYDLIPEDKTTKRVHMELICQRLQQGFQMIVQNREDQRAEKESEKITLSIGRIYHELILQESKITVAYFHPRHPYNTSNVNYYYRIRTPDSEAYGVSRVDFAGERLENYKWNYLDNYICGDSDNYQMQENLKYWRIRLLVLPTMHAITKKVIEDLTAIEGFHCDVYHPFTIEEKIAYQTGFLKLIEIINRIRRNTKQGSKTDSQNKQLTRGSSQLSMSAMTSQDSTLNTISENIPSDNVSETSRLTIDSPAVDILELMKSCSGFFVKERNTKETHLPANTFISLEALEWAKKNLDHVSTDGDAENVFRRLLAEGLICHISGREKYPFKVGFFLYCIYDDASKKFFAEKMAEDDYDLDRQFMEVGVVPQINRIDVDTDILGELEFSSPSHTSDSSDFTFKNIVFELDNNSSKSGRMEWLSVKYHSLYDPEQAFEIVLEWMVATANAIPEIVTQWCRTHTHTGMHIVPIPWDPFALPFSCKSDPLRGPIFISLETSSLSCEGNDKIIFQLQEKILVKFGFIPFCDVSSPNQRNFVHVSGSIFVMIPSKNQSNTPAKVVQNKRGRLKQTNEREQSCSPHEDYITRHFSGIHHRTPDKPSYEIRAGYLWCWNYMITKRWKSNMTGDENSMRKMMRDFKQFCANTDDRLVNFWRQTQK